MKLTSGNLSICASVTLTKKVHETIAKEIAESAQQRFKEVLKSEIENLVKLSCDNWMEENIQKVLDARSIPVGDVRWPTFSSETQQVIAKSGASTIGAISKLTVGSILLDRKNGRRIVAELRRFLHHNGLDFEQ